MDAFHIARRDWQEFLLQGARRFVELWFGVIRLAMRCLVVLLYPGGPLRSPVAVLCDCLKIARCLPAIDGLSAGIKQARRLLVSHRMSNIRTVSALPVALVANTLYA